MLAGRAGLTCQRTRVGSPASRGLYRKENSGPRKRAGVPVRDSAAAFAGFFWAGFLNQLANASGAVFPCALVHARRFTRAVVSFLSFLSFLSLLVLLADDWHSQTNPELFARLEAARRQIGSKRL